MILSTLQQNYNPVHDLWEIVEYLRYLQIRFSRPEYHKT